MIEVAVSNLVEKLIGLRHEIELNNEEEEHLYNMVVEFQKWKSLIRDASQIDKSTEEWDETMKDIRSVVYRAEDAVDKIMVEAKQHQHEHQTTTKRAACLCPCFTDENTENQSTKEGIPAYKMSSNEATVIRSIRDSVLRLKPKEEIIVTATQVSCGPPKITHQQQARKQNPRSQENDVVVGFDEEANTVINRLIGGSKNLETVPITGMLGIGKSTLARKVFKDQRITNEFLKCIWVDVSQTYNKEEILLNILMDLENEFESSKTEVQLADEIHLENEFESSKTEVQLADEIRTSLDNGGRCLIVLDDVWNQNFMSFIESIVPQNEKSHRIMITTRDEDVALCRKAHKLNFLDNNYSWLLLENKIFKEENCQRPELVAPGRAIAEKCGGLPLSIVVIAEDLAKKKTKCKWDEVKQENIGESLIKRKDLLRSVKMSYDTLSGGAKACFLYCATFPMDRDITAWKLIRLWMAEGFIEHDKTLTLEKKAEKYLNDLIKKNLVMVNTRTCDGKIKTCRIHNLLYEFCKKEASKEDLFHEFRQATDYSNICRRLYIGSSSLYNILSISNEQRMKNVRSFLCFGTNLQMPEAIQKFIHEDLPLVKVLDVESIQFNFPADFYQLLLLKYVSFSVNFRAPPQTYGMFWYLETLIINTATSPDNTTSLQLEVDIWSMLRLRHLHTKFPAKLPSPSDKTSNTSHIQTLSVIAPQSCTKEVLARAGNLRTLGIQGNVLSLLSSKTSGVGELEMLEKLESLKIVSEFDYAGDVTLRAVLPKTLRKLTFSGTQLEWSQMSILGQLEFLEVLKLKENAFKGEFWEAAETNSISFTSLLVLWIQKTNLKIWKASENSFPILNRLILISCEELEGIPDSLAAVDNLQFMKLKDTPNAVASAREIEEKKKKQDDAQCTLFKLIVIPPDSDNHRVH